jgi:hypothetical protein
MKPVVVRQESAHTHKSSADRKTRVCILFVTPPFFYQRPAQRLQTAQGLWIEKHHQGSQKGTSRAFDRCVHYHKSHKLRTSMANVILILLSFPMLKSVDPTDQQSNQPKPTAPTTGPNLPTGMGCWPADSDGRPKSLLLNRICCSVPESVQQGILHNKRKGRGKIRGEQELL